MNARTFFAPLACAKPNARSNSAGDMRTVSAETTARLAELLATMSDEVAS